MNDPDDSIPASTPKPPAKDGPVVFVGILVVLLLVIAALAISCGAMVRAFMWGAGI